MAATPTQIWALVSDVTRVGELSPETFEAEWLDGATGPALGARFRGHVKRNGRGPTYWTTCRVVQCEEERNFAFAVLVPGGRTINTWGYHMEPAAGGGGAASTEVTEWFELADSRPTRIYWRLAGWTRGRTNEAGMRTTLERIRTLVEQPA